MEVEPPLPGTVDRLSAVVALLYYLDFDEFLTDTDYHNFSVSSPRIHSELFVRPPSQTFTALRLGPAVAE
jgi:hypothetical protein